MFCPMMLDCKAMTGVTSKCPNSLQCYEDSQLHRNQALVLYFLNQGIKPENIKINNRPFQLNNFLTSETPPKSVTYVYNRDYQKRDIILFGAEVDWQEIPGGAKNFFGLSLEQLQYLVDLCFASPVARQNESPMIAEFLRFAEEQAAKGFKFTFEGYAISPLRKDYRMMVDGITFSGDVSKDLIADFEDFADYADELDIEEDYMRAWWD